MATTRRKVAPRQPNSLTPDDAGSPDLERARLAWSRFGQKIMAEWDRAGSRPCGFWRFEMPPERRLGLYPEHIGAALVYELICHGAIEPLRPTELAEIEATWRAYIREAVSSGKGPALACDHYRVPRWFYRKHATAAVDADRTERAQHPHICPPRPAAQIAFLLGR